MIKLFVGLGNPGKEYEFTRHNAGFWWIDSIAQQLNAQWVADRNFHGHICKISVHGQIIWLLKPQTFMNLSGKAVGALARFFKIDPEAIMVIHDELDISAGKIKIKQGGGHAGHNGLRDIHSQLGSANYWRLRIGIGHPGIKSEVANWVLGKPAPEDFSAMAASIKNSQSIFNLLVDGDFNNANRTIATL